ncbi:MAG: type II toxin-antitoxin system RelE/ParE family toxin [Methanomassiliicoccales archaeon]|nr:MAG: type II toxin-antitoxin system RelE/ParE family toxin [Methanomassiliicoccales archaeon]
MYRLEIKPTADKKFRKLAKKDREQLRRIRNKIQQILKDPYHFKPLKYPLDGLRRVRIGPFVLVYEIDEESQTVTILDYEHHDTVYMR